ncbi:GGDEF domain-containing protein [Marinospirillum alkaliphilum]|uniref:diguanylate cyclase n=1 Tax=Marinospirillum alkaliphilum DSM 21637 TaxID=1122209 RepID=A0A1K1ZWJ0_9GAMM|nr:GGDEF domain-containing protein [Marinospirillum alkaliphilum]SFX77805.1 diguanylate cyclase (GGDEF) domain-containing protein [Marinospirillum alkaliphilum DSM 21637]
MRHRLAYIFPLFVAPLLLAAAGLFVLVFDLLPTPLARFMDVSVWLFALIGGLLAFSYARTRNFFAVLMVLVTYLALMQLVHQPVINRTPAAIPPELSYLLISFLLPLLLTINSLWTERFHLLQDLFLRLAFLGLPALILVAVAHRFPAELADFFARIYFPAIHVEKLRMAQIPALAFLLSALILMIQLIRNPQPYFASQWVALVSMMLMLPYFHAGHAPALITSLAVLMLSLAVLHEAFHMAFRDDLTGLPGRRALNERLQRLGRNYAIAMSDVDHFKKFNDTYGHDIGDQVLKMVAAQLNKVSGGGKAYRYGGEEFTLVFPGKTAEEARPYLEKLREAIEAYQVRIRDTASRPADNKTGKQKRHGSQADSVSVTISMGVAERTSELNSPEEVIKAADKALYKAKEAGRNRIALFK